MEIISVFEAKNKLSKLLSNIEKNDTSYLICRNGTPIAEIIAHKPKNRLQGSSELHVTVNSPLFDDDMSEDFECLQ